MEKSVFTVRQINSYIKSVLEEDLVLNFISVLGEISNFKNHPSGHLYFTVKDEYAALRCVMFKSAAYGLTFRPENGMKVIITGRVSVYDKTGDVQLYADAMQKAGTGNLFLEFEKLKQKLLAEGLFDDSRKKPIPEYVGCVAVITSKSGAAVRDIIQIIRRRNRLIKITVVPVLVQGEGAAAQIARAIDLVNEWGKADCIIVGRGGGS
ncbi:MAG: exodeoxyribonuclease VII large subunit, partial [Clostridiales bacterium]|nr:exodeoxyribonuclease VII large subunit [Clostridiales bacterium]